MSAPFFCSFISVGLDEYSHQSIRLGNLSAFCFAKRILPQSVHLISLSLFLISPGFSQFPRPLFHAPITSDVIGSEGSAGIQGMIVADFDGDGQPDVATSLLFGDSVSIRFSQAFYSPTVYPVGDSPLPLRMADLEPDGDFDLITASLTNGLVALINDGTGSFTLNPMPLTEQPRGIEVLDSDGDGASELVLFTYNGNALDPKRYLTLYEWVNESFVESAQEEIDGIPYPNSIYGVDLGGDHLDDLVTALNPPLQIRIFRNDGTGFFDADAPIENNLAGTLSLASRGPDATLDTLILLDTIPASTIYLSPFSSNGEIGNVQTVDLPENLRINTLAFEDVNVDGDKDIVAGGISDLTDYSTVSILEDVEGVYTRTSEISVRYDYQPNAISFVDWNVDREKDYLLAQTGPSRRDNFTVVFRDGEGKPMTADSSFIGRGEIIDAVSGKFLVEEGEQVAILYENGPVGLRLLRRDSNGFQELTTLPPFSSTGFYLERLEIINLNNDEFDDLAVLTEGQIRIWTNDGTGTLTEQQAITVSEFVDEMAIADFTENGYPDIVTLDKNLLELNVYLNNNGQFDNPPTPYSINSYAPDFSNDPLFLRVENGGGDAALDIYYYDRNRSEFAFLQGRGDGTFDLPEIRFPEGPSSFVTPLLRDINSDGTPDFIAIGDTEVTTWLGAGAFQFDNPQTSNLPSNFSNYLDTIADVTGDGIPDLTRASIAYPIVSVFQGNEEGSFTLLDQFLLQAPGSDTAVPVAADFDGDGDSDLMILTTSNDAYVDVSKPYPNFTFLANRTFLPTDPRTPITNGWVMY